MMTTNKMTVWTAVTADLRSVTFSRDPGACSYVGLYYWNRKQQRSIVPLFLFTPGVVRGGQADLELGEALKNVSSVFFWKSNLNLLMRFSGTFLP